MKFKSLKIENFLAIGEAELELDERGLLLIQGENQDDTSQNSNGAGKSSIVDALCWGLFAQTARGETGDSVINNKAGKNCRVIVTLEDDGVEHIVTRHRKFSGKKNVLEIISDGADVTKGTDKLTQALVTSILGCSYEVFRASIYAGQEDQIDLPAMTDKFLKQIVEEAAGIDRLQQAHELAKSKRNDAKNKVQDVERTLFGFKTKLETLDDNRVTIENSHIDWLDKQDKNIAALEKRLKDDMSAAKTMLIDIKKIDKAAIEAELDTIMSVGESEETKTKRKELNDAVNSASYGVTDSKNQYNKELNKAKKYKAELADADSLIGKPCGECGKLHEEADLESLKETINANLKASLAETKRLKEQYEAFAQKLSEAQDAVEKFEIANVVSDDKKERIKTLRASLDGYQKLFNEVQSKKSDIKNIQENLANAKVEESPYINASKDNQKHIEDVEKQITDAESELEKAQYEFSVADGVVEVYGNTGVRAHVLDTVTPYLNTRTAHYLGQLTDGNITATWTTLTPNAKGELRENFSISVESSTGGKSYRQLSGGEKRKVRLATNMALQDMVSSRASKPLDLYIGDEIDHALDVNGLERLMGVLEERAREHGTVLVISHNELSDWIRESITVVKSGGFTTIK